MSAPERQKGLPEHALSKESKISQRIVRLGGNPSMVGDRTLSPAGSRIPVETPSQRDLAAAHEERGVVIPAGSVSMNFGELIT